MSPTIKSGRAANTTPAGALVVAIFASLLGCGGSAEGETPTEDSEQTSGSEVATTSAPSTPQGVPEHHPDTRWPEAPSPDARYHVMLHPIEVNTANAHEDAVAEIDQFFIDQIAANVPQVFVQPLGSEVPDGLLSYVLDPAIEVIQDSPDRCHVEVQLILETHDGDLRADIPSAASALEGEGAHRQRHAVRGAFQGALQHLHEALERAAMRDAH